MTAQAVERPAGFVYVDTETTGLDARRHHVYELAWAVDDGPIHTLLLPHSLRYAEPAALEIGGYHRRDIPGRLADRWDRPAHAHLGDFTAAFTGPSGGKRTLVCANPAFDAGMLHGKVIGREPWTSRTRRALHLPAPPAPDEPWYHRKLDIEAYTAGVFGWARLKGLRDIWGEVTTRGYAVPAPDHTAAGDVATLRGVHHACWDHLGLLPPGQGAPRIDRAVP